MRRSAWRLAVAAVLFAAWIGYLTYLAATTAEPIVLARPQFLVADMYVIAEVSKQRFWPTFPILVAVPAGGAVTAALLPAVPASTPDAPGEVVKVRKVVWAADAKDLDRQQIYVVNLPKCWAMRQTKEPTGEVWPGPGDYILPLSHTNFGRDVFQVTLEPPTPGFPGQQLLAQRELVGSPIYPVNDETLRQLERITADYHPAQK